MGNRVHVRKTICFAMICLLLLGGCDSDTKEGTAAPDTAEEERAAVSGPEKSEDKAVSDEEEPENGAALEAGQAAAQTNAETEESQTAEPVVREADWSEYFGGFNGAGVIYDASAGEYIIYNGELAQTRRSPCSTFKIISSLIALENGIVEPEDSVRAWSGEVFWNENWNHDIGFEEAFRTSCIWYFREVIDEIGQERMQRELDRLRYGNCDISDWEGRLNTNNNNRALTGFWVESSLAISPKEQTEVMARIFGPDSVYREETRQALRQVMLVPEREEEDCLIYGKTGMGKAEGVTVDAWFTGLAKKEGKTVYFCIYLGRMDDKDVTSTAAKEIAIRIVSDML